MKDTINFAQQNAEQAAQATNWMHAITEQNLNQSRAAFEGLLTIARNAVHGFDHQASVICTPCCSLKKRSQIRSTLLTSSFV